MLNKFTLPAKQFLNKHFVLIASIVTMCIVVFFVMQEKFIHAAAIPVILIGFYWAIFKIDILFLLLALTLPFSTSLDLLGIYNPLGFEISLPTEPILVFLLGVSIYKVLFYSDKFKPLFKLSLFKSIVFYLLTIFIAVLTSELPIVALKSMLSKWWYIFPPILLGFFYFQKEKNIYRFFLLLSISASIVSLYTVLMLSTKNFELHYAHFSMQPFYKDHTVYGASITFIGFLSFFSIFNKRLSAISKILFIGTTSVIVLGIVFSFTRAAWLSIVFAMGVYALIKLKIKFSYLLTVLLILGSFLFSFWNEIFFALNKNSQDSSGNFSEHITSMTNISTDASNLERLNRWFCAIDLWKEKPITGWGPGTYQFEYAQFQKSYNRSLISTNDGDLGNAHSEYLGAMAETGVIGLLGLLILLFVFFQQTINLYNKTKDSSTKGLLLSIILANASYFMHGILNNYLDTIKVAILIWISFSIVLVIQNKKNKQEIIS